MYSNRIHRDRINRAINYAEEFCGDEINLSAMADVACLSKFHFLRVFKNTIGETPVNFLQRIRLERAARKLVFLRNTPITEIAFDSGFGSAQSFSSAFSNRFQVAPRQFRKSNVFRFRSYCENRNLPEVFRHPAMLELQTNLQRSNVTIQKRAACRVAYVRHIGSYADGRAIGRNFRAIKTWARRQGLLTANSELIGISWDNPNVTPPVNCRHDVCLQVPGSITGDDLVGIQTIPGGTYAVMPLAGNSPNIRCAWEVFTNSWLPDAGYFIDFRAGYEVYSPSQDGQEFCCRALWMSVRRG